MEERKIHIKDKEPELQNKRREIFKDTAKLAYNGQLKDKINQIPEKYLAVSGVENLSMIKNEILVSMGLNPVAKYDTELSDVVDAALNLDKIEEPLVVANQYICKTCQETGENRACEDSCIVNKERGLLIDSGRCISCGKCIPSCPLEALSDKIEFIPMVRYLKKEIPVYAHVAPAIVGQFGDDVTLGKLRTALKAIGFTDMVEVALFADILTLHEADSFIQNVQTEDDFLITSCCCPVWVNLLTRHYPELNERLTRTVSPMIASGRVIKHIFPDAITVFIGPCIAKKAEAKVPELQGAIDYVLTFNELADIFEALEVKPEEMSEENKEQSSYGGRIYGRTGGVSRAVEITINKLNQEKLPVYKAYQADGIKDCKEILDLLTSNQIKANFIEGMGCEGGCVGGPKRNIDVKSATSYINKYGKKSSMNNPLENQNVAYILKHLSYTGQNKKELEQKIDLDQLLRSK